MSDIAVIMSVYKNDKLDDVEEALDSLYRQTKSVDIFIQQDGKIPKNIETFLEEEYNQKRIKYLGKRDKNRGLAYSLNELISKVDNQYDYIARMDADDISVGNRMDLQYNFMKNNPICDVVGGYIQEFSTDMAYQKIVKYPLCHQGMYEFFSKRVPLAHVSAFFRRNYFKKAGYYRTTTLSNEDTLLWMDGFNSQCHFANIDSVVVKVRVNNSFFSRRGGYMKAWSDFRDRLLVIRTLGYNSSSYFYAIALFLVSMMPPKVKVFLYKRLR